MKFSAFFLGKIRGLSNESWVLFHLNRDVFHMLTEFFSGMRVEVTLARKRLKCQVFPLLLLPK